MHTYINISETKLDDRVQEGIFVGYGHKSEGYGIYTEKNKIVIARTLKFIEKSRKNLKEENGKSDCLRESKNCFETEISNTVKEPCTSKRTAAEPRRSQRSSRGVLLDRYVCRVKTNETIEPTDLNDITNMNNPVEKENWHKATQLEINSLKETKT